MSKDLKINDSVTFLTERLDFFYKLSYWVQRDENEKLVLKKGDDNPFLKYSPVFLHNLLEDLSNNFLNLSDSKVAVLSGIDEFITDVQAIYPKIAPAFDKKHQLEPSLSEWVKKYLEGNDSINGWVSIAEKHKHNPCFNQFNRENHLPRIPYESEIKVTKKIKELKYYTSTLPEDTEEDLSLDTLTRRWACEQAIENHEKARDAYYTDFYDNVGLNNEDCHAMIKRKIVAHEQLYCATTENINKNLEKQLGHRTPWLLRRFKDLGVLIAGVFSGGYAFYKNSERTYKETGKHTIFGMGASTRGRGYVRKLDGAISDIKQSRERETEKSLKTLFNTLINAPDSVSDDDLSCVIEQACIVSKKIESAEIQVEKGVDQQLDFDETVLTKYGIDSMIFNNLSSMEEARAFKEKAENLASRISESYDGSHPELKKLDDAVNVIGCIGDMATSIFEGYEEISRPRA